MRNHLGTFAMKLVALEQNRDGGPRLAFTAAAPTPGDQARVAGCEDCDSDALAYMRDVFAIRVMECVERNRIVSV